MHILKGVLLGSLTMIHCCHITVYCVACAQHCCGVLCRLCIYVRRTYITEICIFVNFSCLGCPFTSLSSSSEICYFSSFREWCIRLFGHIQQELHLQGAELKAEGQERIEQSVLQTEQWDIYVAC